MPTKRKKPADPLAQVREALNTPELRNLARETVDHAVDPRFNDLDRKEAHLRNTMYDRRPFDWYGKPIMRDRSGAVVGANALVSYGRSSDEAVPVVLRQPDTKYALGRIIANRFAAMLFGQRTFPTPKVAKSAKTERWLHGLMKQVQMRVHMYSAAVLGGATGSVITMFKVVDGRFRLEMFNTKWVLPLWDDFHEGEMSAFSICYPFTKQVFDEEQRRYITKVFLYRRIVNNQFDVTFMPQEAKVVVHGRGISVKPKDPDARLIIDEEKVHYHGLGFVPAQFIQNLPRQDEVDGDSAFEGALDLIDRINENLSAVHHALQGNLDPTLVIKISPEDYNKLMSMGGIIQTGADGAGIAVGEKGDAKYIQIEVENLVKAMEIINALRTFALELSDCVIADPHKLTGAAQSAAAIQLLYSPMLAKCDVLRTQYGENALRKLMSKMIRAYHVLSEVVVTDDGPVRGKFKPITVTNPETKEVEEVAPEADIDYDDIELVWGDYFPPTTADVFQAAEAAVMATGGKPATTQAQAARFLAPYMGDTEAETTAITLEQELLAEQEREDKMAEAQLQSRAAARAATAPKPGATKSNAKASKSE